MGDRDYNPNDYDYAERGGSCAECGEPVEEDHHAYCPDCYREQQGWAPRRRPRVPAGTTEQSFTVGLERVRDQLEAFIEYSNRREPITDRLERRVAQLERRLDQLERREGSSPSNPPFARVA